MRTFRKIEGPGRSISGTRIIDGAIVTVRDIVQGKNGGGCPGNGDIVLEPLISDGRRALSTDGELRRAKFADGLIARLAREGDRSSDSERVRAGLIAGQNLRSCQDVGVDTELIEIA